MIGRGEKQGEVMQRFRRALCCEDEALPFPQWHGMDAAQGEPAVAIRQRDGEILRMLGDVRCNAPPADRAVFTTKVVVICRHREERWQGSLEMQDRRKLRDSILYSNLMARV